MQNPALVADYIERAGHRVAALEVLYQRASWADVVRESQEIVELALKALVRHIGIEVPRVHDVGPLLRENRELLGMLRDEEVERLAQISHELRRDRELAFYGSEDLTPGGFYSQRDATLARDGSRWVVETVRTACGL